MARAVTRALRALPLLPGAVIRALPLLPGAVIRVIRALPLLPGAVARRWRGSLQVRVVSTTLLVSAVVVAILVISLLQQISAGLIAERERTAGDQAFEGLTIAQSASPAVNRLNGNSRQQMFDLVGKLRSSDQGGTASYGVAVVPSPGNTGPPVYSRGATADFPVTKSGRPILPSQLVIDVTSGKCSSTHTLCFQLAVLPSSQAPGTRVPGLVFGFPLGPGNDLQLYYFFPLTQEQQSLSLVQRTLALAGIALIFLLAAIAALVTRWVVVPVARAAQIAQRLSTGDLTERLEVHGTDELATLGTSFNEMAQSLQEKMAELEELSAVQRQFVSDVSHELRTPLATIRIAGDVLFEAREQLDSAAARSAELLHGQLGRFESLLAELLEISRYDANAATLDAEPSDVCDLVRQSADVAQQLAERRGCRIEFRLPADPCLAEVDRRRVERILRNLLVNAVQHGEGRDVVVTVAGDRDAVAVAVRDYGVGLAPGEEQLVFDRFWRADPARARNTGGTGLGLAIALEDARLHGGWLEAWGQAGLGSVFRLTLPRTATGELAGSPLPLAPDPADLKPAIELGTGGPAGLEPSSAGTSGDSDGDPPADSGFPVSHGAGPAAGGQR
jgi:two-component system sensor histidine kinase MtrB